MQRCIELAAKGLGNVAPNPLVGCVLVYNDVIVAEGYHQFYGGLHAEPNAINNLNNDELLQKCTLYVNLEPCCHYGKTPPCANLIISKGIKKVIIGNLDSNPLVAGKGVEKLKDAGIDVECGILDKECKDLNKRFFTFHKKKRPYIILKWAQTHDGFISQWPIPNNKKDNWITGDDSKTLVHQWRAQEQAILIGYNTALADNPYLTTRLVNGKNATRLVLDKTLNLPTTLNVFNTEVNTVLFNAVKDEKSSTHLSYTKINWDTKIQHVLEYCYQHQLSSIIVEGGTKTLTDFIHLNIWDEARVFVNPHKEFKNGILAPTLNFKSVLPQKSGNDLLYTIKNNS